MRSALAVVAFSVVATLVQVSVGTVVATDRRAFLPENARLFVLFVVSYLLAGAVLVAVDVVFVAPWNLAMLGLVALTGVGTTLNAAVGELPLVDANDDQRAFRAVAVLGGVAFVCYPVVVVVT